MTLLHDGDTPLERVLYDFLSGPKPPLVVDGDDAHLVLVFPLGERAALVRFTEDDAALADLLGKLVEARVHEVALVGGPSGSDARLRDVLHRVHGRLRLYHLPDSGPTWRSSLVLRPSAFARGVSAPPRGAPSVAMWRQVLAEASARQAEHVEESNAFIGAIQARRPFVTWALIAIIGAVFALEQALGGSTATHVLVRVGALVPSLVPKEPWRLLSYAFVHIGPMHALINAYVLFVIGSFLERVIGPWRFLAIFALAALGGSIASMLIAPETIMAGASGGGLGLIAAQSVLAFRSQGLLPKALIPGAQRAALVNFGINVVNSLRPGVSFAAHLGGAVVGGALVASGFFLRGLPRLDDAEPVRIDPPWLRGLALVGGLALVVSLGLALVRGGATALLGDTKPARVAVGTGSFELPKNIACKVETVPGAGVERTSCGDLLRDPAVYFLLVRSYPAPLTDAQLAAERAELKKVLDLPEDMFPVASVSDERTQAGRPIHVTTFPQKDGGPLRKELAGFVDAQRFAVVTSLYRSDAGGGGSAERILGTFQPSAP